MWKVFFLPFVLISRIVDTVMLSCGPVNDYLDLVLYISINKSGFGKLL